MTDTFPRSRNGWTDSGTQIASTVGQTCPNCRSSRYRQTLSKEECPDCGLACDYWGSGSNKVYDAMMAAQHRANEEREQREQKEWERDNCGDNYYNE